MRKKRIKLLALCMCVSMMMPNISLLASENSGLTAEMSYQTGLIQPELIEVKDIPDDMIFDEEEYDGGITVYSMEYNSEWDKYSSNYIYNFLSEKERAFWDKLDAVCLRLLSTNKNVEEYSGYAVTEFVDYGGLSENEAKNLMKIFRYCNPQYYFLNTQILYGKSYGGLGVYSSFKDGNTRQKETQRIKAQADTWTSNVNNCRTEAEKVKQIHDLIVNKVEYLNGSFDDEKTYTQSAYSVLCMNQTVCAGYAQAFQLMCNAAGVDCISVTSEDHQWNKVRIDDSWYNVDCTWDDQGTIYYNYFERSDAYYDTDKLHASSHQETSLWDKYLPICTLDSGAEWENAGTLPTITKTTKNPSITYTAAENGYKVSISSATPNAVIYYTIDGTEPTPSFTKSYKYNGAFSVGNNVTVKAVAVCDTYWDSEVVSQTLKNESTNGGGANGESTGGNSGNTNGGSTGGNTGNTNNGNTNNGNAGGNSGSTNNGSTNGGSTGGNNGNTNNGNAGGNSGSTNNGSTNGGSTEGNNGNTNNGNAGDSTGNDTGNNDADVIDSNSVTGKARFIALLYENILERYAVSAEIADWVQELEHGKTGAETAFGFVFSQEFVNKNLNDADYIERLYMSMMGRASDEGGKNDWVTHLYNGVSRLYVFRQFINSDEFTNLCAEYGIEKGDVSLGEARDENYNVTRFVARNYREFLGRDYDIDGLNDWTSRINNRVQTMQEIASGFVFSQECINMNLSNEAYVQMLYRGCFDRTGDEAGVTDWVNKLNAGEYDREAVFFGFANSQEFANMVSSYGL